jgi:hypothetical protein
MPQWGTSDAHPVKRTEANCWRTCSCGHIDGRVVGPRVSDVEEIIRGFLGTLRKTQFAPPEQILDYQRGLLERLLRHARAHVPFYRDSGRLDPLFRPDDTIEWEKWTEIPPLTRGDLQSSYEQLKSEHIPPEHGRTVSLSTAGSTGEPVKVLSQELARRWAWAALRLRDFEWHRIDTTKRLAYLYPFKSDYFDQTGMRRYDTWNPLFGQLVPAGERIELADTRPASDLDDRFHETGRHGTGDLFVDSPFGFN